MKSSHFFLAVSVLLSVPAWGQDDLVPATSEDIQNFDEQVSENDAELDSSIMDGKDNFGSAVSAEAKKLKDMSVEERQKMGQWVSGQRRKDADKRPAGVTNGMPSGAGSTMGAPADARTSAPALNDVGRPSSGQGQTGSNRPGNRGF